MQTDQMPERAKRIFEYIQRKISTGKIKHDRQNTYLTYGEIHSALDLDMSGDTIGTSLSHQGLSELARFLFENEFPPITGLVVNSSNNMPADSFFTFHGRTPDDFAWWQSEMKRVLNFNWNSVTNEQIYPDEINERTPLLEGAAKTVTVNAYERNSKARMICIQHYGLKCVVCDLSLVDKYGDIGSNYIHVHHLYPDKLRAGSEYVINPIKDLRPVCPNCHAMLHTDNPPLSIETLKSKLLK